MTITLTIENPDALPQGQPARFQATQRPFVIGRDSRADWSLPDPSRFISSRHCEVRFENSAYWLHDGSTNGVFLNGAGTRIQSPHRLSDGDRLRIGPYRIRVAVEAGRAGVQQQAREAAMPGRAPAGSGWDFGSRPAATEPSRSALVQRTERQEQAFRSERPRVGDSGAMAPDGAFSRAPHAASAGFVRAFCQGAGIAPEALAHCDPDALAREVGEFVKLATEGVSDLLRDRAAAKAMTKSANRTVIAATDNNPLKHVPTAGEAIEVMFARRRQGYLDARRSLSDAFGDLKRHELATYAAMQQALDRLLEPLSPESVEVKAGGSAFASRKSRAWDIFVERWEERDGGANGMLDAFFAYFAEAYDEASAKK